MISLELLIPILRFVSKNNSENLHFLSLTAAASYFFLLKKHKCLTQLLMFFCFAFAAALATSFIIFDLLLFDAVIIAAMSGVFRKLLLTAQKCISNPDSYTMCSSAVVI
jgi:hypothetical protein